MKSLKKFYTVDVQKRQLVLPISDVLLKFNFNLNTTIFSFNNYEYFFNDIKMIYNNQLYFMIKSLNMIVTIQFDQLFLNNKALVVYYNTPHNPQYINLKYASEACSYFFHYCLLLFDNCNQLDKKNSQLLHKIKEIELKLNATEIDNNTSTLCKMCVSTNKEISIIRKDYNCILNKYSACQEDREKMIMKYVHSEKRLIDNQRMVNEIEKQYKNILKENKLLQKRNENIQDEFDKLSKEIIIKSKEMLCLRKKIEDYEDNFSLYINDSQSKMKLKSPTDIYKKSECRLIHSSSKVIDNTEGNKTLKLQGLINSEKSVNNAEFKAAELRLQHENQNNSKEEQFILCEKDNTLDRGSIKSELNLDSTYSVIKMENDNEQILKCELSQIKILEEQIKRKEQSLQEIFLELNKLQNERRDIQADVDYYRQQEIKMLEFTQRLTDKNIQLQIQLANMETEILKLRNSLNPLHNRISNYISDIKNLRDNLHYEKNKSALESESFSKLIAKQLLYIKKLQTCIEYLQGENVLLRTRYAFKIHNMIRELHLYQRNLKINRNI